MILETERLILRPVVETDVPNIQHYFPHWEIVQFMGGAVPWPYPDDGALSYFHAEMAPYQGQTRWIWAINEKNNPDYLIGVIELRYPKDDNDQHMGYWLALPFHGRGYMTEAVNAVMNYGFVTLAFAEITAASHPNNPGSRSVQSNAGMTFLGEEPCSKPYHDGIDRHLVLGLTRDQWLKLKAC